MKRKQSKIQGIKVKEKFNNLVQTKVTDDIYEKWAEKLKRLCVHHSERLRTLIARDLGLDTNEHLDSEDRQ